ncbi:MULTISPECIES: uracil phosphoribosyltransferase [Prochlorococcus]|uniref:Uracil phosphoribosyltransferase n=1 Tax=Prochlorococcus marinus str. MIT 9116 TaxID=167544 RepID=A0A0A1ZPV7_PROMR|nr:uracil phosphoribosyltransferase [Prochlorococcus marinus]KGF89696.1 Uracil phosphoribosyltransferase [Prochlorococcus marinus str. MIT 9107]KGF90294.1 Uracil phosphoribosyltransferase [Prochlorococcus marinus str. MIT 9116]KGF92774.1 Uracil phosphoribosyltransferase [Prochlorococcus marinus str. MIT 9123]
MAMSLKVIIPPHPLIKHWLSILREKNTPNILYTTGYEQLGKWLTYEALRNWLPYKKEIINTYNGDTDGFFINNNYPIKVYAMMPEGLSLWYGSKEVIPNSTLSLGEIPKSIESNEGVIFYSEQVTSKSTAIETLLKLKGLGVESNRILLITAICTNKGLNEIAKLFPNQVIYTSCIDEEDENTKLLIPGIGNPLLRLSTIFHDKN